jgi:hypothetical protein
VADASLNPAKIDKRLKFRAVFADTTGTDHSSSARNRQRLCIGVGKT